MNIVHAHIRMTILKQYIYNALEECDVSHLAGLGQ